MKIKVIYFILGFASCLGLLILSLYPLNNSEPKYTVDNKPDFDMSSTAYEDEVACPDYSFKSLVGRWSGQKIFDETGELQEWVNTRFSNGHYRIEFVFSQDGKITKEITEEGLWSYSGCLYTVIVKKINSNPVLYQEVYRVHEVTDLIMRYSNFRTGNEFTLKKSM